jgi:hypothetical protein
MVIVGLNGGWSEYSAAAPAMSFVSPTLQPRQ